MGGHLVLLRLDDAEAETRYRLEPKDELTAEKIYERRWAITLLEEVLARLGAEFVAEGKASVLWAWSWGQLLA